MKEWCYLVWKLGFSTISYGIVVTPTTMENIDQDDTWEASKGSVNAKNKQGVGLAIYIKKYLKAKRRIMETQNISP